MLRFLKGFFSKPIPPAPEAPYKVEPPAVVESAVAPQLTVDGRGDVQEVAPKKAPAKKRTFKKREEGGTAKVAKIKAPRKPKAK